MTFLEQAIFRILEPYNFFSTNLESSNFLRRCEYIERKTPSKNILEFLQHFSSRSHHKLFFGPPCTFILMCRPRRVQMYLYNMFFSINNKKINRKTYEYKKIMARLTIWKWMNYVQFYSLIIFIIIFISYIRIFIEGIRFFFIFL